MDYSPPGSSVHGILQVRILEWVAMPFSRDLPSPGMEPGSAALRGYSLPSELPEKAWRKAACLTKHPSDGSQGERLD